MNYYEKFSKCVLQFRVVQKDKDIDNFCGTGFLVGDSNAQIPGNTVFRLVTNRHVAEVENLHVTSNLIRQIINVDKVSKPIEGLTHSWKMHDNATIDVASIPFQVAHFKTPDGEIMPAEDIAFFPDEGIVFLKDIDEGDEVFFLGFPHGIGADLPKHKPILRKGYVSFKKENSFLIDGFSFPGNSGSPVFLIRKYNKSAYESNVKLAGIISGGISSREECVSIQTKKTRIIFEDNMGLSEAFSADAIKETFQNVPKN